MQGADLVYAVVDADVVVALGSAAVKGRRGDSTYIKEEGAFVVAEITGDVAFVVIGSVWI